MDLILDIFDERDANMIVVIPPRNAESDTWYWRREKLGVYSVKSPYYVIQGSKEGVHSSDNSGFWRQLWNLKIPSKFKHFLWRVVTSCFPTKDKLRMRKVDVNILCPTCNASPETIVHALVECSFSNTCMLTAGMNITTGEINDFADWLELVFQQCTKDEIRLTVMT